MYEGGVARHACGAGAGCTAVEGGSLGGGGRRIKGGEFLARVLRA